MLLWLLIFVASIRIYSRSASGDCSCSTAVQQLESSGISGLVLQRLNQVIVIALLRLVTIGAGFVSMGSQHQQSPRRDSLIVSQMYMFPQVYAMDPSCRQLFKGLLPKPELSASRVGGGHEIQLFCWYSIATVKKILSAFVRASTSFKNTKPWQS